ncbi:PREDICTED: multiple epidermal growth factor-like domains protein 6 [Branchiostoma belcheri]|uniref:Multiple epidermal growth factor-like domains protein 6 n=1 Tax=Branchiostoma belcheri TaxID=7741 RepID=A0A6P4ZG26_BRABE|nr:PREDICTED: multiple epidermal growth factor-like domains protein 6 [Branchiostoma belcheri]
MGDSRVIRATKPLPIAIALIFCVSTVVLAEMIELYDCTDGKYLNQHDDDTINGISIEECAERCMHGTPGVPEWECSSFDYMKSDQICLLSTTKSGSLTSDSNYWYCELKDLLHFFDVQPDHALGGLDDYIVLLPEATPLKCAWRCLRDQATLPGAVCYSFEIGTEQRPDKCLLSSYSVDTSGISLDFNPRFDYYQRSELCIPSPCVKGYCVGKNKVFTCMCDAGWGGDICNEVCAEGTFGQGCHEICHCALGGSVCDTASGICSSGGCIEGWSGPNCQADVNECLDNAGRGPCAQICTNTDGSYTCSCRAGYSLNDDGHSCDDVCIPNPCIHGHCVRHINTFTCMCDAGWGEDICDTACSSGTFGSGCSSTCHCAAGDSVCATDTGACSTGGCSDGWQGLSCQTDIDECLSNDGRGPCAQVCTNTPGHYVCSCSDGYKVGADGHTCEACGLGTFGPECSGMCHCAFGNIVCDSQAGGCSNGGCASGWIGSNCQTACQPGYFGQGCTGICHCASGDSVCYPQSGVCSSGGCAPGWEGRNCQNDVNECSRNTDICHTEGTCVNTEGSYKCTCNPGYQWDGISCKQEHQSAGGGLSAGGIVGIVLTLVVLFAAAAALIFKKCRTE